MLVVIDYGAGNLRSVVQALTRLQIAARVSRDPQDILTASKLILPGVGHFAQAMASLKTCQLIAPLNEAVISKKIPILGICLGMQLFSSFSSEGECEGLGWIEARTEKIVLPIDQAHLKIPHMGWNSLNFNENHPMFADIGADDPFYFAHSYHVSCQNQNLVAATTSYGIPITAAVQHNHIHGVQFHPEKSHEAGMKLLTNFVKLI